MKPKAIKIWLAKDKDGQILPYSSKPIREQTYWCGEVVRITNEHITDELYSQLQWEDEHPKNLWRNVEDELPPKANGPFLRKDEKDKLVIATDGFHCYYAYRSWTGKWTNFYGQSVIFATILYWMPIPETPKGGES